MIFPRGISLNMHVEYRHTASEQKLLLIKWRLRKTWGRVLSQKSLVTKILYTSKNSVIKKARKFRLTIMNSLFKISKTYSHLHEKSCLILLTFPLADRVKKKKKKDTLAKEPLLS
jgi:hypothetical protein